MSGKELERFDPEEEMNFEKFTKSKFKKEKERKKSLRDYRGGKDKRSFEKEKRNDNQK